LFLSEERARTRKLKSSKTGMEGSDSVRRMRRTETEMLGSASTKIKGCSLL
jgi:hypothetical protein